MKKHLNKWMLSITILCIYSISYSQQTYVDFSEKSGVKQSSFELTLSTEDPSRNIFYTLDGTIPNENSIPYSEPILIEESTLVSAISYSGGIPDSLPSKAGYMYLSADMFDFTSNLPVLIISNLGQGSIPAPEGSFMGSTEITPKHFSVSALYEPSNGRTSLLNEPTLEFTSGIKVRGSSSSTFPKKSYGYDAWDSQEQETDIEPLGLAKSADWILFGSRNQDPTYIRSILPYAISNQMGQWAPRSKAVEVFINTGQGPVSADDYLGIYFFMEKIGRGKDKIDIEKLDESILPSDPKISGGYILKLDRLDPEATGFNCLHSSDFSTVNYYSPKERNMPEYQMPWIQDYIADFEYELQQIPNSRDYMEYFDINAAIDHWLLKAIPMDADAFILSEFFHKDRYGVIKMGPIWDLDRSAGSVDTRTEQWNTWSGGALTNFMEFGWYGFLHNDPEYMQALKDRWFEVRQEQFSEENIDYIIDSLVSVMQEAMTRDIQLWPISRYDGTFQGEIDALKTWYHNRLPWVDEQFGYSPIFRHDNIELKGNDFRISSGYNLSISTHNGQQGTLYYTTDGSDPRMSGGAISSSAQQYSSNLTLNNSQIIKARIYNNGEWSAARTAVFFLNQDLSKLKITEIHYHPSESNGYTDDDLEFIELKNIGSSTLYLAGVHFTDGIEFAFPLSATVEPGEFIVLASNINAFQEKYGFAPNYQYSKQLSNDGEDIEIADIAGSIFSKVTYNDNTPWPVLADGDGFSLVPITVNPNGNQNDAALWRVSSQQGGSPGEDDVLATIEPIYITEILANSAYGAVDAIELYNPNNTSVNIGGWILSDSKRRDTIWTIPSNATIEAGEYMVFYEGHYVGSNMQYSNNEFGSAFSLRSHGEEIYLFAAENGVLTGYSDGFDFADCMENVTYGFYEISTGEKHVVPFAQNTLGFSNSNPRVGPLVIDQINYNPVIENNVFVSCEFLRIKNISDSTVLLYDPQNLQNTWVVNGLSFSFPENTAIEAGETFYLKNDDITNIGFRTRYSLAPTTKIFTFIGALDNNGETISLKMPLNPYVDNGIIKIPHATTEKIKYNNTSPWPLANGNGMLLQRIDNSVYGNDPANWSLESATGIMPELHNLTVVNGVGSGSYEAGQTINLIADAPDEGYVFHQWLSTRPEALVDIHSSRTKIIMPGEATAVTAEYRESLIEKIINSGESWRYNNTGTDLYSDWLQESYNDSGWPQGITSIGYEAGETTTIEVVTSGGWFPTALSAVYFRKTFNINDLNTISDVIISMKYDDGAVVYLNGQEAFRASMPSGTINYSTGANAHTTTSFENFTISPSLLREGSNTIQVEVHHAQDFMSQTNSYLFDLEFEIERGFITEGPDIQNMYLHEGWSMRSLGITPSNNKIEDLFPNALIVKTQNGLYIKGVPDYLNTLTTLNAGDGFMIFNSIAENVQITGYQFTGNFAYSLKPGWNLIGVPRMQDVPIQSIINDQITTIKDFDEFYPGIGAMNSLEAGEAFHVFATENTVIIFYEE